MACKKCARHVIKIKDVSLALRAANWALLRAKDSRGLLENKVIEELLSRNRELKISVEELGKRLYRAECELGKK